MSAPDALPIASGKQARQRLIRLLKARSRSIAALLGLSALSTAASLTGPAIIGRVVDILSGQDAGRFGLGAMAAALALAAVISALAEYRAQFRAAVIGEDALAELRTEVFDHAVDIGVDRLERAGTGELVSRVTGDVSALTGAVRYSVPAVFFALLELAATLGALLLLSPLLTGPALAAALPVGLLGGVWYARHAPARYRAERQAHADLAGGLLQAYRGAGVITLYRAQERTRHRLAVTGRAVVDTELASASARNRLYPSVSAAQASSLVAVLALGSLGVGRGAITVGAVTAAALYMVRLFGPVSVLLKQLDEIQQASASLARLVGVTQLTKHRTERTTAGGVAEVAEKALDVRIRNLSFEYLPGEPVLANLNLEIAAGERVVIVGPSGAGKSTLAKLICGVHHPSSGTVPIKVEDKNLKPGPFNFTLALQRLPGEQILIQVSGHHPGL
ncbi:MAG: ABC transporter transmembrane domain-containing protein [Actinomycetota bacterium]